VVPPPASTASAAAPRKSQARMVAASAQGVDAASSNSAQ
jgi:hypothetical protein